MSRALYSNEVDALKRKRIGIITPAKFPGTAGDTANYTEIINQMDAEGMEVILICPAIDKIIREVNLPKSTIIRIPIRPPRLEQIRTNTSIRHYISALSFMFVESIMVLWILKRKRINHVFMRHGLLTMQLPFLLKLIGIRTVADGETVTDYLEDMRINKVVFKLLRRFEKRAIKAYSFFKVSSCNQAQSLEILGYPKERILIVPVSINVEDIPKYRVEELPANTFGYFGVLEKWQGINTLFEAFLLLLKKIPTAKLYIIGDGSMKEELRHKIDNANVQQQIILVDGVTRNILWEKYFNKFRVMVIPRPRQNNSVDFMLPIKLVESLASGKPTIAVDIPIMKEIPPRSIYLIPSPDPQLLADAMERLSTNEALQRECSAAAMSYARNYDIRTNIKKLTNALLSDI